LLTIKIKKRRENMREKIRKDPNPKTTHQGYTMFTFTNTRQRRSHTHHGTGTTVAKFLSIRIIDEIP
jgi:hypothetical protein